MLKATTKGGPMATKTAPTAYENNPLFIATKGLELLFKNGISIAILLLAFIGLNYLASIPAAFVSPAADTDSGPEQTTDIAPLPPEVLATILGVVAVVVLVCLFIGIVIRGVMDYSAARLAKGAQVNIGEALGAVFSHFFGYTWVLIIVAVKTFLWSLLFIVPGIIMSVRYSLAGVSYFDKKLTGNTAVKDSLALTKGAWLTTYAAQSLLPILTLGALQGLTVPGTTAILYRQYNALGKKTKPAAHIASWLTLILPIVFVIVAVGFVVTLFIALAVLYSDPGTPSPLPYGLV